MKRACKRRVKGCRLFPPDWELVEPIENGGKIASPKELEKMRRDYVFGDASKLKPAKLDDLRGMPHIVEEIKRIIEFLRNYRELKDRNVRIQPGIFLYGEAGTGKTLTARIIATESGVKLIDAGGFPRLERGWKASDIRSLFALAKDYYAKKGRPVIVYFDEFDSVCPAVRRYRSESSTALMSELDGMEGKPEGVFVIAAANYHDVDDGLLRAGRLGQQIHYSLPEKSGRTDILRYYLEKKPHEPVDVEEIAEIMPTMSPAEIEELVERAYMKASLASPSAKLNRSHLIMQLLEDVLEPSCGDWPNEEQRYRACVHEAGHVVVAQELGCQVKLVVVPKKKYVRGITISEPLDDPPTLKDIENKITTSFGGEAAEELVLGERDLASTEDISKATELSIKMVAKWADTTNYMDNDEINIAHMENKLIAPLGEDERSKIYADARAVREKCLQKAREILKNFGKGGIERVAKAIFDREFLLKNEITMIVKEKLKNNTYISEETGVLYENYLLTK